MILAADKQTMRVSRRFVYALTGQPSRLKTEAAADDGAASENHLSCTTTQSL